MSKFIIRIAEPDINEEEAKAAYESIIGGNLRYGPQIEAFEKEVAEYIGVKYAVAVSSGTAALHVALLALGIKPGDEVILPSFSCVSPAIATILSNAKPVFADIETRSLNIDPEDVKKLISPRTKVIIPIHYNGHPAEMDPLLEIAKENNVYILEDAAEALGAEYKGKRAGSLGHVAVLSFSPNKTITTGEGGMILTNDYEIYERARIIADYGQKGRFNYIVLGHNYHMTAFQAAIGLIQMKKIDQILDKKRMLAKLYSEILSGEPSLEIPFNASYVKPSFMSYYVKFKTKKLRDKVMVYLNNKGIETRIYFPPLHKSPYYQQFVESKNKLWQTEEISSRILNIPLSPKLSENHIYYISNIIKEALHLW
jgi:perosamine synthetase